MNDILQRDESYSKLYGGKPWYSEPEIMNTNQSPNYLKSPLIITNVITTEVEGKIVPIQNLAMQLHLDKNKKSMLLDHLIQIHYTNSV